MRFKGCNCVCCGNTFTETDDAVVCPVCGSPHHRECWNEKGECANTSLHGEGFSWAFPEELKPKPRAVNHGPVPMETNYTFKNGESAIVCPHCNALNYGNDAFCMKCRKPLFQQAQNEYNENSSQENGNFPPFAEAPSDNGNAFEYFQQFGGVRPDIMIDGIPVIEYSDYIGEKKSGRYIRRFLNMDRFGKKFSVSVCAFIFGPIWYFYRKMFKEGLLFLLALLVISGLQTWCSLTDTTKAVYSQMGGMYSQLMNGEITMEEMDEYLAEFQEKLLSAEITTEDSLKQNLLTVADFMSIGVQLAMCFFADYFYKKKCKKDILKIREECSDMLTYRRTLHERGGVFTGGAVLGTLLVVSVHLIKIIPAYFYMFSNIM